MHNANAQTILGNTGLLNSPTADMQESGTFICGATYLPKSFLDSFHNYETGMYYFNLTPLSWVEVTFRETLAKGRQHIYREDGTLNENGQMVYGGKTGYYFQDRSYTVRLRPLREKEGKWWPSVVIGSNDPWSDNGGSFYSCVYGVVTKHLGIKGIGNFGFTAGYAKPIHENDDYGEWKAYKGVFGGVGYTPAFWDKMMISAEYDTQGVNIGANVQLFNHWNIYACERDFKKVSFGMSYQFLLPF